MRALVLSTVFPSRTRPAYGVFVRERARHVAAQCDTVVVSPVPWVPFNRWVRGDEAARAPFADHQDGIPVYRPRFLCLPELGKTLDGVLYAVSIAPFLLWLRRRFPFDLIDAHFSFPDGVAAAMLGKLFRCPSFITLRGTHDQRHASYRLRRGQIQWGLNAVTRVITVSESLRQFAIGLGIDRERIRVIPNGIDPTRFFPGDRGMARTRLDLPSERTILLAVGSLVEAKGHRRIIELLPSLIVRCPRLLYVAIGAELHGTGHRKLLESLVARLRLNDHVRIMSSLPHPEIRDWMVAADLFCLATSGEGWCNAIMEALACGLPVVTTRVGGNPELVSDGRDGLLVPFWDAEAFRDSVVRALDIPWDRRAISARASTNGWDRTASLVMQEFARSLPPASGDALDKEPKRAG
jgi:glycosyltransferase involved in cell wall biosynthesis